MEDAIQPIMLMPPKLANVDGIIKTPAPIILPSTNEVLVHKPNFLTVVCMHQDKKIKSSKITRYNY